MTKLNTDIARTYEVGDIGEYPLLGSEKIFEGSAVGIETNGYARALQAGDKFAGFADEKVDNTEGTDGEKNIRTKYRGIIVLPAPSGIDLTSVGADVYASDDNTFTTTPTGNSYIGKIRRVANNEVSIDFEAFSASQTPVTK